MLRTLSLLTLVVLVLRVEAAPPESQVAPTPRLKPIQKLEPPPHIEPRAKIVDPPLNLKLTDEFEGRNYRGKPFLELSRYFGSTEETERATARGLAWLARQQKLEGNWLFDGSSSTDTIAATGMSLLPYLGTGQTHKKSPKYSKTVERGLTYLIAKQKADGSFETAGFTMYTQGIATIALCEAYAMTKDRDLLLKPAQKAIDFIVKSQGENGSWGYQPGTRGDTSILGWNVQALYAAILSKDIVFHGVLLKKGDQISLPQLLTGLDERENKCPMHVDFSREKISHTTFGQGPHLCLGQHLARREIISTLTEWLARIPDFRIAPGAKITHSSGIVGSISALPLVWDPATTTSRRAA